MKIALIAMSGIRVADTELLEMGLTLPGFVERSKIIASLPSLGLLTLAGMTPKSHQVDYYEIADLQENIKGNSIPQDYDLVAISSYGAQINEAYLLGDIYHKNNTPVVMGGLHVSFVPKEAIAHCDAVVIGEGELSWPDVLKDAENKSLKPFYGSIDEEYDLNDAPLPAFGLLDIDKYNRLTIQTSRGCPHQCEFCASSTLLTDKYKQKPAEKVLAEIDAILEIWPKPFIELADDNTFINISYWRELLPEIKKRNIRWFTETDISIAKHPDLLELMRESGCAQVLIGLESPLEPPLDGLEIRSNWKMKQWTKYKDAIRTIQSHAISVNGCFVLGLDGQMPEIFDTVFDFVEDSDLSEVQITIQTAFPGTPLYKRLQSEDRIIEENAWHKLSLFDVNFIPKNMSLTELRSGFHSLAEKIYSEEVTQKRREKFKSQLRQYIKKHK
ncbi:MAG: radical SAM protein [candidate division Zixibacteria bacterium]